MSDLRHLSPHGAGTLAPADRRFAQARRHSALVTVLKWSLPALAVAIVLAFAIRTVTSGVFEEASLTGGIGLADGKLVMDAPVMKGFDKNNRPYDVVARKATQDLSSPKVVALDAIDARVPVGTNGFANVDAEHGIYDTANETLELSRRIEVRGLNGVDMDLTQASIDMKAGTMTSTEPVQVRQGKSSINAGTMLVKENGKRIVFGGGRVRMVIDQAAKSDRPESDPSESEAQSVSAAAPVGTVREDAALEVEPAPAAVPAPRAVAQPNVEVPFVAPQSTARTETWILNEKPGPFAKFEKPQAPIEGLTGFTTVER